MSFDSLAHYHPIQPHFFGSRPWSWRLGCSLLLALLLPGLAPAQERLVVGNFSLGEDAQGVPKGWQLKEKSGRADFSARKVDGLDALLLRSANTSFSLQRPLQVDLKQHPILSWKWKVSKLPKGGDFRRGATDDQAAQLFLAFSRTQCIVYLWDTTAPEGLMADAPAPPFMSVKVVVVRSGPAQMGKWLTETRNVYEDYKRLYGGNGGPPVVSGLRLQINSQHTKSSAESAFAEVSFNRP